METLTAAAINWELGSSPDGVDPIPSVVAKAEDAIAAGAGLVVLPENAVLELLCDHPDLPEADAPTFLSRFSDQWVQAFSSLSKRSGAFIVAGSIFEKVGRGIRNVCPIVLPDGRVELAAKCRLTTYEREVWNLVSGDGLYVLSDPPIGVAICYDSEFPEAVRALAEAGASVICIPAFTEGRRGFQRVRWCAQATAVANQVFVLHASLVGGLGREPAVQAWGTSAVLCPSHEPFPDSAILAETDLNRGGTAIAELDFTALERCRSGGDVRNWHDRYPFDWPVVRIP